jgi:hypothetical protein
MNSQGQARSAPPLDQLKKIPRPLFCRFLGMQLSLSEHSFENDRELNFQGDSLFKIIKKGK